MQVQQQTQSYQKTGPLFVDDHRDEPAQKQLKSAFDSFDISELYKQIGAPNPIVTVSVEPTPADKAPVKLKLKKRASPDINTRSALINQPFQVQNPNKIVHVKKESESSPREQTPDNTNRILPTLFNVYPETDDRLVYKKHQNPAKKFAEYNGFASHFVDANKLEKPSSILKKKNQNVTSSTYQNAEDKQALSFDSTFESGNLYSAYKVGEHEYDLILQNDINTNGYTQWFYFSVQNTRKDETIKFNIVNLLKPGSLFNDGMQPVIYSTSMHKLDKKGWFRGGSDVSYYKNTIVREGLSISKMYYTLTFTYTFSHSDDTVYFAHCFPYTYTRLSEYLETLCKDTHRARYVKRQTLCETLAHNNCEHLTITDPKFEKNGNKDERPVIFLTARQHPGESLSSFMMEGILQFLTSEEEEARILRRLCIFQVIPMLNPDGVMFGNYRASLCGKDLNRKWKSPKKALQPTIYYTKQLIRNLSRTNPIKLFCDFHGHSRKKNAFFYGNSTETEPLASRIFPFLLSKISKYISFDDSRFTVHKSKESTARIALWRELNIDDIFTLEASFYGYSNEAETSSFTEDDYRNVGRDFCKGLALYLSQTLSEDPSMSKSALSRNDTMFNMRSGVRKPGIGSSALFSHNERPGALTQVNGVAISALSLMNELKENKMLVNVGFQSDDSGSDSDPSGDELPDHDLDKLFDSKLQIQFKRHKSKLKSGREKIAPFIEASRRSIRQPSEAQVGSTSVQLTSQNKEERDRSSSTKDAPFRIKNFKRFATRIYNKEAQSIASILEKPKGMDISCQTEDTGFVVNAVSVVAEEAKLQQQQQLSTGREMLVPDNNNVAFKRGSPRNFRNNIIAVKHITSSSNLGSLTLLNQNAFLLQPAKSKFQENGVCLKGSKLETDLKSKIAQPSFGKHQSTRGTTTDINMQTDKDLNLYNIFRPSTTTGDVNRGRIIGSNMPLNPNNNTISNEKKVTVEIQSPETRSKPGHSPTKSTSSISPKAQVVEKNETLPTDQDQDCILNTSMARTTNIFRKYIKVKIPPNISETQRLVRQTPDIVADKNYLKREFSTLGFVEGAADKSTERISTSNPRLFRKSSTADIEERNISNLQLGYNPPLWRESIDPLSVGKKQSILRKTLKASYQKALRELSKPGSLFNETSGIKKPTKISQELKDSWRKCNNINEEVKYVILKRAEDKIFSASMTPKRDSSNPSRNFLKK